MYASVKVYTQNVRVRTYDYLHVRISMYVYMCVHPYDDCVYVSLVGSDMSAAVQAVGGFIHTCIATHTLYIYMVILYIHISTYSIHICI